MRIIESKYLPNGLTVEFYDCSKKLVGDRWNVGVIAKVPVKVEKDVISAFPQGDELFDEFVEKRGDVITFELKKERIFIDEKEKDKLLVSLLNNLKKHVLSYLSHEKFALGFLKREFEEYKKQRIWCKS